jgi:cytochrome c1
MRQLHRILLATALALLGVNVFAQTLGVTAGEATQATLPAPQTPGRAEPAADVQTAPGQVEAAPPAQTGPVSLSPAPALPPSAISPAPSAEAVPPMQVAWSFDGPFGVYDRAALQRGFQIYKEVCSACHALSHVAFRNLGDPGGPEFSLDEVKAIAAGFKVPAGPNEQGQTVDASGMPLTRPGAAADYFPPPFPSEQAARAANNGALPPDLSLIVKARAGHQNYVYSILTGFGQTPPPGETIPRGLYYNPYFPRHQIAMPPPLTNGSVSFADGTPNTVDQEAHDIATFLTWASEPKMDERKQMGFTVMLYLIGFTVLLFLSYRRVWHGHHDAGAVGEGTGDEARLAP